MDNKTKKVTMVGMLCAVAFLVTVVCRIPVVLFLKYEPKDVVISIGGFIGLIMNVLSTCSFACTASFIYKKHRTMKGAVAGLLTGVVLTTAVMLLWNYLITPIYMGYPREAVKALLIPAFLPFNLLKGGINMALTLLIYKPVVTALRSAGLVPASERGEGEKVSRTGIVLVAALILITCVFFILVLRGIV